MEYVPYSVWKGQGSSLEKENIWLIVLNSWDLITSFGTPLSLIPITNKTSLWLVFSTKESQLIRLEYLNDSKTNKKFEIG